MTKRRKCGATTRKGTKCRNRATAGKRCHLHTGQPPHATKSRKNVGWLWKGVSIAANLKDIWDWLSGLLLGG